ncbi:tetratricopeptide repeat protein [Zavarzinia compransoris]|uniref:tetratricopeptide repeat protein n=1 Tax=Zavarzinia marina TaxID=2911065 RepID=UPI001F32F8D7|nr:tetratricopeptide repeat protein [Zavarzinia marina]MCF4166545.1 tetratricopeptide repeat protein [Zavarzinia marina]
MDGWIGKLVDLALGGMPGVAAGMVPENLKRQWLERLSGHDPFKTIASNEDLVRATRLAWIEAAQDVLAAVRRAANNPEWTGERALIEVFQPLVEDCLAAMRDHALDRQQHPGETPVDRHLHDIMRGSVEATAPGDDPNIGASVPHDFAAVLADLTGWSTTEIPAVYDHLARAFDELAFAAFAELLKDPGKYPQARDAFRITMDHVTRDIASATFGAVQGLDIRLDQLVATLDGPSVFQVGAARFLDHAPQLARDTAETRVDVAEVLRMVSQDESVPLDTLRAILSGMGESADDFDTDEIGWRLADKAQAFKTLINRLHHVLNDDPVVRDLRGQAVEALRRGQFSQADAHLAAAEARDLDGLDNVDAVERQRRLSAADNRAERGAVARMRANPDAYREAAAHYSKAADLARPADDKAAFTYDMRNASVLRDLSDEFGDDGALLEACEILKRLRSQSLRDRAPQDWAGVQNNLGNALAILGERESGTVRLEQAVVAYRAALEETAQDNAPMDWSQTQYNLGHALQALGERESGTAHLEEAVVAFHSVLQERTRDREPLEWAAVQNNLGNVLAILGGRASGTAHLEEAVAAYRSALEEWTRDLVPLDWAMAQSNLGAAMQALGERESGTVRLEDAVKAYRLALEENTRDRAAPEWAATQNNLGNVLAILGARESGTAHLEEAVAAYRSVLEAWTRDCVPLDWAMAQNNLGNALLTLGERESGTARLEEAVVAFRSALEERTRDRMPLDWAMTQNNLGNALQALGEQESRTEHLEEAVLAYRSALEERARDCVPLDWALTQNNLGNALRALGEEEGGTARLEEAVLAFRSALEERTRDRVPLDWAMTQNNMGNALLMLGERESGTVRLRESVAAYRSALEERTRDHVPLSWAMTQYNLGNALSILGEREGCISHLEDALAGFLSALEEWTPERFPHYRTQMQEKIAACRALIDEMQGRAG